MILNFFLKKITIDEDDFKALDSQSLQTTVGNMECEFLCDKMLHCDSKI